MARTLTRTLRTSSLVALGVAALVSAVPASAATARHHPAQHARFGGQTYVFAGTVSAPATSTGSLQVAITGGNRPALRALVGNTTSPLGFTVDARTSYIEYTATDRANAPVATTAAALKIGDPVHLRIRARYGAPLARLLANPTRIVADFAAAQKVDGRLFLFAGRAVSVDTTAQTVTVDINRGNWPALNALLGQPTTQTFHYDSATLFLSWNHRTPHAFDPSAIKAGDPITIRTRATPKTPLANLLAAPLWKVNDHEPSATITTDGGTLPLDQ